MTEANYQIKITTDEAYANASTNASVFIQFLGESGNTTEWRLLDNFFRNDFEQGRTDNFNITVQNVGRPVVTRLKLEHYGEEKDTWSCENIAVQYNGHVDEFPIYDWIENSIDVLRGEALIESTIKDDILRKTRKDEVAKNKKRFQWDAKDKTLILPRHLSVTDYDELPQLFKRDDLRREYMKDYTNAVAVNVVIETVQSLLQEITELDHYRNLYSYYGIPGELPAYIEKWKNDDEMGRQMLNGVNPAVIARCNKIPDSCMLTEEHVNGLLNPGKSLEEEMAKGRIYILDHSKATEGVQRNVQFNNGSPIYCPDAMALFYSPGDGRLLPIAIQLEPGKTDSLFTPKDVEYDWMLAKMYFRCADSNIHEWTSHFLLTHAAMEPIAIALFRCLPRSHPIYKLLRQHLRTVIPINQLARRTLLADDAVANYSLGIRGVEQARRSYETFNFDDLDIPKKMNQRGVLDPEYLPNYFYRDDALRLWGIVQTYVSDIIKHYYKSEKDVIDDVELQDFIKETAFEGFGWADNNTRGCPTSFNSCDDLIKFCTIVAFTSSVQHAATNFAQFDIYKFIPNCPVGMRLPPHKRGEATLQRILDSLPDVSMSVLQIGLSWTLSAFMPNEVYLGDFPQRFFTEPEVLTILDNLKQNLEMAQNEITKRNEILQFPYEYLMPDKIPSSIAI